MTKIPTLKQQGFTLIEVLIALAIVAIALTAIVKATSDNVEDTTYLQQKTIAYWVVSNVLNEARLGLIAIPVTNERITQLGQPWYYSVARQPTGDPLVYKWIATIRAKPNGPAVVTMWTDQ